MPHDKKLYPYLKNPFLRIDYYSDQEFIIPNMFFPEKKSIFKTNAFGFRSSSMKGMKKDANTYRIFFIGGSTTEQPILMEEETSWKIIEDYLNKHSKNLHFECINAGKSGYITSDSVALLAHKIIHYDPDMVIVMHAINDLCLSFLNDYDPMHRYMVTYSLSFKEILKGLYKKSHLLIFLKRKIFDRIVIKDYKNRNIMPVEDYKMKWKQAQKRSYTEFASLDGFKKNIKSLIGIAKANSIRICFLTQPTLFSEHMSNEQKDAIWLPVRATYPDIPTLYNGMELYNAQIRELCKINDVEYIDLAEEVPKELRYFYDSIHYTSQGAHLVAEVIIDYLWQNRDKFERNE